MRSGGGCVSNARSKGFALCRDIESFESFVQRIESYGERLVSSRLIRTRFGDSMHARFTASKDPKAVGRLICWNVPKNDLNLCKYCNRPTPYQCVANRAPWLHAANRKYTWITRSMAPEGESFHEFHSWAVDACIKCISRRYKELKPTWEMLSIKKQLTEIGREIRCKQQEN